MVLVKQFVGGLVSVTTTWVLSSHTRHTTVMTKTWPQSCDNKPRYRDLEQRHGHLKGTFFIFFFYSNVLYACAEVVSFPNQRPQSLVWERDWCTREIVVSCPDPPHSACSLVPRPCAFVASSTKLAQRRGPGLVHHVISATVVFLRHQIMMFAVLPIYIMYMYKEVQVKRVR